MTVSNFVNDRLHLLSDTMKERVEKSIKELNYRRNYGAHVLRTSQVWSIGLIIVDRADEFLSDGYTTQIVSGFSNHLNSRGYSTLLQGVKPEDFDRSNIIRNLQTDGIGVLLSGDRGMRRRQFDSICTLQQPMVLFLENFEGAAGEGHKLCAVKQDEFSGGAQLAQTVLNRLPEHVAILTSGLNEWAAVNRRIEGMYAGLRKGNSVKKIFTVPCGDTNHADVHQALEHHVRNEGVPDAMMCISDNVALSAISFLRSRCISVPEQTCVTGFNAFRLHEMCSPTITTMFSPAYEMGQAGAKALLDCLDSDSFEERLITYPGKLIQGESA
ncbi:LacI family transcriptional regulator [Ruegeria sp. 2012CJ41-6]|uniref:LacI family transcriptional regulator n=2 Tax=Ruegeria spongiae TaxID=2942209 RepID=A0ABT0Q8F3_9RHOB|nr:LacI family transcriptional regulator [Ruegeria spongiae]